RLCMDFQLSENPEQHDDDRRPNQHSHRCTLNARSRPHRPCASPGRLNGSEGDRTGFHRPVPHSQRVTELQSPVLPTSILRIAWSTAFFMLRVSAPWRGGYSARLCKWALKNGPAAVGAHSFEAKNLRSI